MSKYRIDCNIQNIDYKIPSGFGIARNGHCRAFSFGDFSIYISSDIIRYEIWSDYNEEYVTYSKKEFKQEYKKRNSKVWRALYG